MPGMMVPYLHITGGDNLFFKSLQPSSHGAIAGACICLFVLALMERFVHAVRYRLGAYWRRRLVSVDADLKSLQLTRNV
jgi:solute carrier family 31 (copper transporter), member 1